MQWRKRVADVIERLITALLPDETVLGVENVKKLKKLQHRCRKGSNADAFTGGFWLWER